MELKSKVSQPCVKLFVKRKEGECPFCHSLQELNVDGWGEDQLVQWEDYVTNPMVWCWKCEAIGFLDPDKFQDYVDIHSLTPSEQDKLLATFSNNDCISVPLLFIERMADSNMRQYKRAQPLTLIEMELFLQDKLKLERQGEMPFTLNYYPHKKRKPNLVQNYMSVSVPVQSYNVTEPSQKYPSGVDLSHDGNSITCLVRMPNGLVEEHTYWGD